jgi:hypothetical protein
MPDSEVPDLIGHSGSTASWLFWYLQLDLFLSGTGPASCYPPLLLRELW